MSKKDKQVSTFSLEGRFIGFIVEDGFKIKRLRLATAEGEYSIKLTKESRASVGAVLLPGDWIQVWGEKTIKLDTEEIKLKAYKIAVTSPGHNVSAKPEAAPAKVTPAQTKSTILVCQKSDCMKRGGKGVCKALEAALDDRGLTDQVTVRGTGCMKQCKAGPNVIFNKTRYTRVTAEEIPALVDQHFPSPAPQETAKPVAEPVSKPALLPIS